MWLVTGVSGQLGSVLFRALRQRGIPVTGFASPRDPSARAEGILRVELAERREVTASLERVAPLVIIHAAAVSSVAAARADPEHAYAINALATESLADYAAATGARFVFVSTDMVFDGESAPYHEDSVAQPVSEYGRSKLAGERRTLRCSRAVIARLPLLYGFPPIPRETTFLAQLSALREGRELTLFSDEFRTPLCLEDAAGALIRLAESDYVGHMHVGGPERLSRLEMGQVLAESLGLAGAPIRAVLRSSFDAPEPRPRDLSLDSSRYARVFGMLPGRPMRERLATLGLAMERERRR